MRVLAGGWLLLAVVSSAMAGEAEPVFRAGATAVDITPQKFPVSMTGSFLDRKAVAAHDRLHARALVLDDGRERIALVIVDSCLIRRETFDAAKRQIAKKSAIRPDRVLMAATHTHTAPAVVPLAQIEPDPEYVAYLIERMAQAVLDAESRLVPAEVGWTVVRVPDEVHNRRWFVKEGTIPPNPFGEIDRVRTNPPAGSADLVEPAGPIDPDVTLLSIRTREGVPLCVFANYPLHYVGHIPPQQLSADYFGEFARQLTVRIAGDSKGTAFVGILSNGASGDINNINFRDRQPAGAPFERVRQVAKKVAEAVAEGYAAIEHKPWVPLAMVEREIELGVRRPDDEALAAARTILAAAEGPVLKTVPEIYAHEAVELGEFPARVPVKLQALRIGGLALVGIPCEPFVEIGLDIKKQSPFQPTAVVGLANGYRGYLPTPRHHELAGYETWRSRWSYLEPQASVKITAALLEMLAALHKP